MPWRVRRAVTRLARAEKRVIPSNPLDALSDDELEIALATVRKAIEAKTGMTESEMAADFEDKLKSGGPFEVDSKLMRDFIAGVKRQAALEKMIGRPIGRAS